jgi:hypothetical protein
LRFAVIGGGGARSAGWYVEQDGKRVAVLVDPQFEDMFWYSYRVEALTTDPATVAALSADEFWRSAGLTFRNVKHGEVTPGALPAGAAANQYRENGRVWMRALYLPTLER